jgi:hypothetical protein
MARRITLRRPFRNEKEVVYRMANGREFRDSGALGGIYQGAGGDARALEDGTLRLTEDGATRFME